MDRFEFQRIGRKEIAITGEITIYKPSYEWLTDSKGNSHYVMVDEKEECLNFNVDDLTETLKIDELNFIGEPFRDWIVHYPKLKEEWIAENIYTSSTYSKNLIVHCLRFIADIMTEWCQYGVMLTWPVSSETRLEHYIENNGKYLEFPIYNYHREHYAVGLKIDVERFFAYMWDNESLKKWLRGKEECSINPKTAKIYDYQTAEEAAIQLLNIKAKQIKKYGR